MADDWLRYTNQGKIRNKPLSEALIRQLSFLPDMGVSMEVFSGGQEARGLRRTGSTRHNNGNSADVFFYRNGRKLDWANPDDVPVFSEIVQRAKANGVTGFGAGEGYMMPGSMHIGAGNPAVWGRGGKSRNAPGWLRAAFGGTQQPDPIAMAQGPIARPMPKPVRSPMGMAMTQPIPGGVAPSQQGNAIASLPGPVQTPQPFRAGVAGGVPQMPSAMASATPLARSSPPMAQAPIGGPRGLSALSGIAAAMASMSQPKQQSMPPANFLVPAHQPGPLMQNNGDEQSKLAMLLRALA